AQCAALFGAENVLLIVSETLKTDLGEAVDKLTKFLNTESLKPEDLEALAGVRSNTARNQEVYAEAKAELEADGLRQEIFEYFLKSNQVLDKELDLKLSGLGYID